MGDANPRACLISPRMNSLLSFEHGIRRKNIHELFHLITCQAPCSLRSSSQGLGSRTCSVAVVSAQIGDITPGSFLSPPPGTAAEFSPAKASRFFPDTESPSAPSMLAEEDLVAGVRRLVERADRPVTHHRSLCRQQHQLSQCGAHCKQGHKQGVSWST